MQNKNSKAGYIASNILSVIFLLGVGAICYLDFFNATLSTTKISLFKDWILEWIKGGFKKGYIEMVVGSSKFGLVAFYAYVGALAFTALATIISLFLIKGNLAKKFNTFKYAVVFTAFAVAGFSYQIANYSLLEIDKIYLSFTFLALAGTAVFAFINILINGKKSAKIVGKKKAFMLLFSAGAVIAYAFTFIAFDVFGEIYAFNGISTIKLPNVKIIDEFIADSTYQLAINSNKILNIAFLALAIITALNFLITAFTACGKSKVFGIIRFLVQFLLGAFAFVYATFFAKLDLFDKYNALGLFINVGASLLALFTALIYALKGKKAFANAKAEEHAPGVTETAEEETEEPVSAETNGDYVSYEENYAEPQTYEEAQEEAPVYVEQVYETEEPAYEETEETVEEEPAYEKTEEAVEEEEEFYEEEKEEVEEAEEEIPEEILNYEPKVRASSYDNFFDNLSQKLKYEFDNLFISRKQGTFGTLPAYSVGGDNKVFFKRVFIYLASYRKYISNDLLNALHEYINK